MEDAFNSSFKNRFINSCFRQLIKIYTISLKTGTLLINIAVDELQRHQNINNATGRTN